MVQPFALMWENNEPEGVICGCSLSALLDRFQLLEGPSSLVLPRKEPVRTATVYDSCCSRFNELRQQDHFSSDLVSISICFPPTLPTHMVFFVRFTYRTY